jgi:hypothetical protein
MDVPNVRKRPFQFGIGTLFLTTTAVAVGFSIGCLKKSRMKAYQPNAPSTSSTLPKTVHSQSDRCCQAADELRPQAIAPVQSPLVK